MVAVLRYPRTAASAVANIRAGEAFWRAFGNLMEHLKYTSTPAQKSQAFWRKPMTLGDVGLDALVAALTADLAIEYGVTVPAWCMDTRYFLAPGNEYWDWKSPKGKAYLAKATREPYLSRGVRIAPNVKDIV